MSSISSPGVQRCKELPFYVREAFARGAIDLDAVATEHLRRRAAARSMTLCAAWDEAALVEFKINRGEWCRFACPSCGTNLVGVHVKSPAPSEGSGGSSRTTGKGARRGTGFQAGVKR
jgi:hypothetical protein